MFRIAKVILAKPNKTITVVCPEIAGDLSFDVKPMRTHGIWRTPNKGDSVVILGEANNYLYAGRSDDAETYSLLITYIGDGKGTDKITLWSAAKVLFSFLLSQFGDPITGLGGHFHASPPVPPAPPVPSPYPVVFTNNPIEHAQHKLDVETDRPGSDYIRVEGNDV